MPGKRVLKVILGRVFILRFYLPQGVLRTLLFLVCQDSTSSIFLSFLLVVEKWGIPEEFWEIAMILWSQTPRNREEQNLIKGLFLWPGPELPQNLYNKWLTCLTLMPVSAQGTRRQAGNHLYNSPKCSSMHLCCYFTEENTVPVLKSGPKLKLLAIEAT